ncbi:MAG: hypothetical protein Q4F11_06070, partial [Eubacteriales bacterium]|nr:hypothetical protein [Eubacteriales bacterium]
MYVNVTDAFIQATAQACRTFKAKVKINNTWYEGRISSETITSGSTSGSDIAIGSAVSARLEITMKDIGELFENTECQVQIGILLGDGSYEYVPMGFFTAQKPEESGGNIKFTAYDRMMKTEKAFISSLTYPATALQVLDEACKACGITRATIGLGTVYVSKKPEGYTCREIIGYMASLYGKFACIDREGKLQIKWYEDPGIQVKASRLFSFTKNQSDFILGFLACNTDKENQLKSGTGARGITFDNPWMTQERLDTLYKEMQGFTYRPAEFNFLGDIRLDPWDIVTVTYLDGVDYKVPVMSLTQKYDGGINTEIKAYGKTEEETSANFQGPVVKALQRTYAELLIANEIIAKKVDAEWVKANTVTTEQLTAVNAEILNIKSNYLQVNIADVKYAKIDLTNIAAGTIKTAM